MNEQIQKAIDKFKIPRPKITIGEGLESAYLIPKSELLSLLKQVAEDAHLDGRSVYIKNKEISADKIQITCEHPTFEDYWKTLTEQL